MLGWKPVAREDKELNAVLATDKRDAVSRAGARSGPSDSVKTQLKAIRVRL